MADLRNMVCCLLTNPLFCPYPIFYTVLLEFKKIVSFSGKVSKTQIYVPPTEGGGNIVFGADPVGVCVGVRVASFPCVIF